MCTCVSMNPVTSPFGPISPGTPFAPTSASGKSAQPSRGISVNADSGTSPGSDIVSIKSREISCRPFEVAVRTKDSPVDITVQSVDGVASEVASTESAPSCESIDPSGPYSMNRPNWAACSRNGSASAAFVTSVRYADPSRRTKSPDSVRSAKQPFASAYTEFCAVGAGLGAAALTPVAATTTAAVSSEMVPASRPRRRGTERMVLVTPGRWTRL